MTTKRFPATRRRRGAQTLLELIAAATIIAIALVPALRIMRDAVRVSRETEMANLMATFSASKLEEHLVLTAGGAWNNETISGNFAAQGYANLRFRVVKSDSAGDGGITNMLTAITCTVWDDRDSDAQLDSGEPRVTFATKLARNLAYEQEATGN